MDDLRALAAGGVAGEVLDGRLMVSPPRLRRHQRAVHHLARRFRQVVPASGRVRAHDPVRLPGGDGPVPDLLVTTAGDGPFGWPAAEVHTVVEVVATDGRYVDRVWKKERYAVAGIPCYWRVELAPARWLRSPLPVVVVRYREPAGWQETVAAAGRPVTLPVAYDRGPGGSAVTVPLRLDPATLLRRQATGA